MKNIVSFVVLLFLVAGCHRKTIPPANTSISTNSSSSNSTTNTSGSTATTPVAPGTVVTNDGTVKPAKVLVIVNAKGDFAITEKDLPVDASKDILNAANARAYTPEQTKNLAFRHNIVPPRILYVPETMRKTSGKGTYYVYNKKFWYWRKANGYFYLDENYYK